MVRGGTLLGGTQVERGESEGGGFTAIFFTKGFFVRNTQLQYVGGEVEVYKGLDPNLWSFFKALSLAKKLDTTAESVRLWWKPSNLLLDKNLKKLTDDVHALEMSEYVVKNHQGVDIYVEYNVTTDEGNADLPNCIENIEVEAYGSAEDDDKVKGIAYDLSDEENGSSIDFDSDYMVDEVHFDDCEEKMVGQDDGFKDEVIEGSGRMDIEGNGVIAKDQANTDGDTVFLTDEVRQRNQIENDIQTDEVDSNSTMDDNCERLQVSKDVPISTNPQSTLADKVTTSASDWQSCSPHDSKLADKAHEDSILKEARIIEVKRKRIMELSAHTLPSPILRKSHWDIVLEEMTCLANDFAQKRLWKTTASAVLAKAVMQFWHSVELLLDKDAEKVDSNEASRDKQKNSEMESSNCLEGQNARKTLGLKVHSYALRYIMDSRSHGISSQAEAPATPDKVSDSGTVDMSWEENLTETLAIEDLKPEPVLWHEDSGSKYEVNQRCAKYRLTDVHHEEQKATTSGQHAGGNDAGVDGECHKCGVDERCNICYERFLNIRRFGLFPGCMHPFCLQCIMHWRQSGVGSWTNRKSCPTCRQFSPYIVPSTYWISGEAKATYIQRYMQRCSTIDCIHYAHGDGRCPQRHYCFYRHTVHPGSYRWMHQRSPPPPTTGAQYDDDMYDDDYLYDEDSQPDSYS